ncbi:MULTISPECIES: crotonase/enoyl-CoA hydratase family protein [unclassified Rhizobium]|uniref:crotonase/enoyl-CoA hydratase family protein n=1 Tax=unclassified Rhizobium TaxID=2613769 RepID=UPI00115CF853|nr:MULTISPECIES: crotonase/enoyl-CoA hydratase family protein [unclassified Rhizobium]MBZ5761037.1 crotonase/enoyl-CoA hydratase family protein [Rhizobium sp. VS19-DR96]MBZ5767275.1 crotonase/enoyl-CoA hydratase family protein [Rhizobium sp. VS19-DR129.2]MBZ5773436.1 crotonase/enoyl-CoA hydratase family protein [Rhizobium sp. VS19-DRK62.2]MBZ5785587.1 crotonase/enoyl-CoA hydratase family protein [Rhizobium sp. VS19-DR121]MBZ5802408.1 crotonase/enoyl-CoA hydratase family protein [Rhizobium sp. 
MTDHILIETPEAMPDVRVLRFNRPEKKNAITRAMYAAMTEALQVASAEASVHVVVFLGQPGCFSAGNDMSDFLAFAMGGAMGTEVLDFLNALAGFDKPLVSGVDGMAIGIGTTIHMHCDLTLASGRSMFRTPFVDLALVPEAASSLIAPRLMGYQHAFALLAAGEPLTAEEARRDGLIWKVTTEEALEEETLAVAAKLAAKPPGALKIARDLLRGHQQDITARIAEEAGYFEAQLRTAEARAAFEGFFKR